MKTTHKSDSQIMQILGQADYSWPSGNGKTSLSGF